MATTRTAVAPMKAAQITKPGGDFEIVEREIPKPSAGQVRIKIQACGVCHSDMLTKEGAWPSIQYPRVPGHEVAASSTNWVKVFLHGSRGNGSVSAGMAVRMGRASRAAVEILSIART